jgi:hypothetical protein
MKYLIFISVLLFPWLLGCAKESLNLNSISLDSKLKAYFKGGTIAPELIFEDFEKLTPSFRRIVNHYREAFSGNPNFKVQLRDKHSIYEEEYRSGLWEDGKFYRFPDWDYVSGYAEIFDIEGNKLFYFAYTNKEEIDLIPSFVYDVEVNKNLVSDWSLVFSYGVDVARSERPQAEPIEYELSYSVAGEIIKHYGLANAYDNESLIIKASNFIGIRLIKGQRSVHYNIRLAKDFSPYDPSFIINEEVSSLLEDKVIEVISHRN